MKTNLNLESLILGALMVVAFYSVFNIVQLNNNVDTLESDIENLTDSTTPGLIPSDPDGISAITLAQANDYIANYYAWVETRDNINLKGFNTNYALITALQLQKDSPVSGQKAIRIYYGLTRDIVNDGGDPRNFMHYILVPVNDVDSGNDLNPDEVYMVRTNELNWRPCPPYCDRTRGE